MPNTLILLVLEAGWAILGQRPGKKKAFLFLTEAKSGFDSVLAGGQKCQCLEPWFLIILLLL